MDKLYIAPEAKLFSFVAVERMATGNGHVIDFDDLRGNRGDGDGEGTAVTPSAGDISVPAS